MVRHKGNAPELDVISAVSGKPLRQVALRHEQAAGVEIPDVEHDQIAPITILGNVIDRGCACKPMHNFEADRIMIKHGL